MSNTKKTKLSEEFVVKDNLTETTVENTTKRFKIIRGGYRFDTYIFKTYCVLLIIITAIVFYNAGGYKEYVYASCPANANVQCYNELYGKCDDDICKIEYLVPGETIGEKPPADLMKYVDYIGFTIILPFLINHLWHNRKVDMSKVIGDDDANDKDNNKN